jgi:hypothetical protein
MVLRKAEFLGKNLRLVLMNIDLAENLPQN